MIHWRPLGICLLLRYPPLRLTWDRDNALTSVFLHQFGCKNTLLFPHIQTVIFNLY
nr:MAG TPA: hypothetical protein [Caudoviricetes sp.]